MSEQKEVQVPRLRKAYAFCIKEMCMVEALNHMMGTTLSLRNAVGDDRMKCACGAGAFWYMGEQGPDVERTFLAFTAEAVKHFDDRAFEEGCVAHSNSQTCCIERLAKELS